MLFIAQYCSFKVNNLFGGVWEMAKSYYNLRNL